MLRWLVLVQAVIYLLLMPSLRANAELGYNPPLIAALIAVAAFSVGAFVPPLGRSVRNPIGPEASRLQPRSFLSIIWVLLAIAYAFISVNYGLLNRRQGSEYMAELYATLPLPALAVLRGYEILLVPIIILYAFGSTKHQSRERWAVLLAVIATLPFMGLADSRGRLLVMGIYLVSFLPVSRLIAYFYKNWQIIAAAGSVVAAFVAVSLRRAADYGSTADYLFMEVYSRLDGLNLVTRLKEASLLSYWGQFDYEMLSPLIARIPFLEAAETAKLLGRTSTKQYVLQDLLRSRSLDDSNSMITDPLYFAGILGVVVAFFLLGWTMRRFDRFIAEKRLLVSFWSTTVALSFVTSFAIIENDFVGSLANMALVTVIIGIFLGLVTTRTQADSTSAYAHRPQPAGSAIP